MCKTNFKFLVIVDFIVNYLLIQCWDVETQQNCMVFYIDCDINDYNLDSSHSVAASWVPFQYSYSVEKCEDCERMLTLTGLEPTNYRGRVLCS